MLTCSQHDAIQLNFTDIESFRTQLFRIQIQSIRAQLESVRNQTAGRFVPISIYIYLQHLRREWKDVSCWVRQISSIKQVRYRQNSDVHTYDFLKKKNEVIF